jgi:hypothetical protein
LLRKEAGRIDHRNQKRGRLQYFTRQVVVAIAARHSETWFKDNQKLPRPVTFDFGLSAEAVHTPRESVKIDCRPYDEPASWMDSCSRYNLRTLWRYFTASADRPLTISRNMDH